MHTIHAHFPKPKKLRTRVQHETMGDLLLSLGGISAERIRMNPTPGSATKRDLIRFHDRGTRLYELVEGTLVEKPMGHAESYVALELAFALRTFLVTHDLGYCTGSDDLIEVMPRLVRGPDVSFTSWLKRPDMTVDSDAISKVIPDLVVEVLSEKNTRAETARKLGEYFLGGIRLVWVIDPRKRTAVAYTDPDTKTPVAEAGSLDGGDVLPGFRVPLAKLFERLEKPKLKKRKRS